MNHAQIAEFCFIEVQSVKTTLQRVRERYGAASTTQCLAMAIAREEIVIDHDGVCYAATISKAIEDEDLALSA